MGFRCRIEDNTDFSGFSGVVHTEVGEVPPRSIAVQVFVRHWFGVAILKEPSHEFVIMFFHIRLSL